MCVYFDEDEVPLSSCEEQWSDAGCSCLEHRGVVQADTTYKVDIAAVVEPNPISCYVPPRYTGSSQTL